MLGVEQLGSAVGERVGPHVHHVEPLAVVYHLARDLEAQPVKGLLPGLRPDALGGVDRHVGAVRPSLHLTERAVLVADDLKLRDLLDVVVHRVGRHGGAPHEAIHDALLDVEVVLVGELREGESCHRRSPLRRDERLVDGDDPLFAGGVRLVGVDLADHLEHVGARSVLVDLHGACAAHQVDLLAGAE